MNRIKRTSFVVIAYNEENNIVNCIESILNQKELDCLNYEIIIVNDGSTDQTADIIIDLYKNNRVIRLIDFEKNMGRGFARFKGVENTSGDYIVFIDADIVIPENWLARVKPYLLQYDAVGGIATPDGDVTYICQKFKLKPKPVPHTTGITGSNVIYKSEVLKKIKLNPRIKDGEDTDLNWRLKEAKYKSKLLEDLIVIHKENIDFKRSIKRIFSFGVGATGLFKKHKNFRMPDLVFLFFLLLLIVNIVLLIMGYVYLLPVLIFYPVVVGFGHIFNKFYIKRDKIINLILAGFTNSILMISYFFGRILCIMHVKYNFNLAVFYFA